MSDVKQITEKDELQAAENGLREITIRRGEASPVLVWQGYYETGLSIDAVQEYLKRDGINPDEIKDSYILFSYEGLFLQLRYADRLDRGDKFHGTLKLHPELEKWQINKPKAYDHSSLSSFIKMNRHFFQDKNTAMMLVSELRNIRLKVDKQFESADDRRGNARELIAQELVESNIPSSFVLNLPIFVGTKPRAVEVEIEINPKTFEAELISPDLKEIIDLETRAIMDEQLDAIRNLYPQLRIFQK